MPQQNDIRAVLFDFDGTLRHNDPPAHHFFFDHAASLGAADSEENRRAALRWAHRYWNGMGEVLVDAENHGQDTPEFWLSYSRKYLAAFNCPPAQAKALAPELTRHMREAYTPNHRADSGAHWLLHALRRTDLVVGVVSNRDKPYTELLDLLGISSLLDFSLAAGEVQSWKPDPAIFAHALAMAGTAAEETIYVGDNYYADVVGARRAGLHPVLYDPEAVFPDADCPVIRSLAELLDLLGAPSEAG